MNQQLAQFSQITRRCPQCLVLLVGLDEIQRHRNPWLRQCAAMRGKKKQVTSPPIPPPDPTVALGKGVVRLTVHEV